MPGEARPRVLLITRKWPPAVGGMETYSVRLAEALEAHAEVEVLALPGRTSGAPPSGLALIGWGLRTSLRLLFRGPKAGIVHVGDMAAWPLGWIAGLRARRTRTALSAHGTDVSYPRRGGIKGRLYGAYLRLGARLMRRAVVIANSRATADCTAGHGFPDPVVIPLATDLRAPTEPAPPENFILFSGRLVERKGARWFVREVLPRLPGNIRLHIAGTRWHGSEADALADPRVAFLGPLPQDELAMKMSRALCVVTPNIPVANGEFEGFGLVATEATAAGGVSLAARLDGLTEAVIDGVTGFLLAPADPEAWAAKIIEVAGWDFATRAKFIARATRTVQERFTWSRVAAETFAAYGIAAPK